MINTFNWIQFQRVVRGYVDSNKYPDRYLETERITYEWWYNQWVKALKEYNKRLYNESFLTSR